MRLICTSDVHAGRGRVAPSVLSIPLLGRPSTSGEEQESEEQMEGERPGLTMHREGEDRRPGVLVSHSCCSKSNRTRLCFMLVQEPHILPSLPFSSYL